MHSTLTALLGLALQAGSVFSKPHPPASETFFNRTIYTPPADGRALYARIAELHTGSLLVTSSLSGDGIFEGELQAFPLWESEDGGASWTWISNITDQVNGWGMSAQPALLELRRPLGKFKPGTVLAAGNSWSNNGTRIDLYASTDKARTWEFVSHVAEGGRPNTTNGATPVWEPFLLHYEDELVVYYSDQRDPLHGQKLSHQTSSDLLTWGPVVNDARFDEYLARPGMTTVAYIPPIDKWIVTYELPVGNSSSHGSNYPVNYRLSDSPLTFDSSPSVEILITLANGTLFAPNASPYVVWSPSGGPNGTIIVSDADYSQVYVNTKGGAADAWEAKDSGHPAAYSRALHVFEKKQDLLVVVGGDTFDGNGVGALTLSVESVASLLGEETGPGKPPGFLVQMPTKA
ncbi:Sialidase [Dichotomopilus funicola]|uniref:Sialidase n=1 Tax=Dichotomopilus funicola TaxID=1934379 RepID=A0AAN6V4U1_9PEZI|nr:Sialidase [Dichotomopilus funicola]